MAQHQELKRKESPSCQTGRNYAPPPLSIEVPKMRNLSKKSKPWSEVQLPVDILLLTVEDCEFLACYAYINNPIKSYHNNLGYVYFGTIGESGEEALKVALMKCCKGSSGPGGSQNVVKNAVIPLRPKAVFTVGHCRGLNPQDTKLGDVVVSSKLTTEDFTTPVRKNIGNLILFSSEGWNPPLKDPPTTAEEEVKVHSDSEIFSGINDPVDAKKRRTNAAEKEGEGNIFIYYLLINFNCIALFSSLFTTLFIHCICSVFITFLFCYLLHGLLFVLYSTSLSHAAQSH